MMRYVVAGSLLVLAACGPTNSKQQFNDWSYRTRDKSHNRYDGYASYHVREEQWQTDPYWTMGEGLQRRRAAVAKDVQDAGTVGVSPKAAGPQDSAR